MMVEYELTDKPDGELDEHIRVKTREYNAQFTPPEFQYLSIYCRDDDGKIVGGLTAKTYWDYFDIEFLWVDERVRRKGVASKVIAMGEAEAKRRGCTYAQLDTFEFQALGFYKKAGYELFGTLEGYCGKYQRYYLKKAL
ncbi:MAG: GNAT family N-acetyltransferase [Stappiaceae bacterium]